MKKFFLLRVDPISESFAHAGSKKGFREGDKPIFLRKEGAFIKAVNLEGLIRLTVVPGKFKKLQYTAFIINLFAYVLLFSQV